MSPEYCRLFAYKKAYKGGGGVTGTPGPPPPGYAHANYSFICLFVVGEEDELSIKEAAEWVVEGMQFTGQVEVSFVNWTFKGLLYVRGEGGGGSFKSRSSTHWQATVVTDSKSLLLSLQLIACTSVNELSFQIHSVVMTTSFSRI